MRQKLVFAAILQLLVSSIVHSSERIEPKGIVGSLFLSPDHNIDFDLLDELKRDDGENRLCIVVDSNSNLEADSRLIEAWTRIAANDLTIVRIRAQLDRRQRRALGEANCIWVAVDSVRLPLQLGQICQEHLSANHRLILTGACSALAFDRFQLSNNDPKQIGWKLIPDANAVFHTNHLDGHEPTSIRQVGLWFSLSEKTDLLFQERRFRSIESSPAILHIVDETAQTKSQIVGQRTFDLTALRRSLRKELVPPFRRNALRTVSHGSLLIVGGGRLSNRHIKRFVADAGGERAKIVIFPTSLPDPIPESLSIEKTLRKEVVDKITVLRDRELSKVESSEFLEAIDEATGIWFNGGRQWRFVDAYQDTAAESAIHRLLRRGGVIGGSSAGASIQGDYLARGNPLGNMEIMARGYEKGLGFLPGVAIDQHFSQRNRLPQLKQLVSRYPQFLGIGIDESTAIYVKKNIAEIMGKGEVYFLNQANGGLRIITLKDGHRFDLATLNPLEEAKTEQEE